MVSQLTMGDDPILSKETGREKYLQIGQPELEQEKIWNEKAAGLQFQKFVLDQMLEIQQKEQMVMQPQQPAPMQPGQPPMQPGMEQGLPPEQMEPEEEVPPEGMPPEQMPPTMPQYPPVQGAM